MKCPICDLDLSPLDLVSRTEHVDLCIENGPSVLEVGESGGLVIKKTIAPGKQRKICPICDKTFQNLNSHFKTCALKNDIPPNLMLDYWDKIQVDTKNPKKFPRELLDGFVAKCVKEGRIGEQVDFARALSMSMAESEPKTSSGSGSTVAPASANTGAVSILAANQASNDSIPPQVSTESSTTTPMPAQQDVSHVLMQYASGAAAAPQRGSANRKKFRLETVDASIKRSNIELRIDRELAAPRLHRYRESLRASGGVDNLASQLGQGNTGQDDECVIIISSSQNDESKLEQEKSSEELNKLFHRARLKDCTSSKACLQGDCEGHDLLLLMEEFAVYAGASMDAPPKTSSD